MSTAAITRRKVGNDLTEGGIYKKLITFALPIILANLLQQLYGMADLIIIGKFVGSAGTVGVSAGGELSDLMTPIATSFATAGQIYIAHLYGAKDEKRMGESIGTLLSLMMCLSLACAATAICFHRPILSLLNCPPEAYAHASAYMMITAAGMPFIFGYNAICGILRGMGDAKRTLLFVAVAAASNILGDLLLVVVIPMEAAGTAIATVLSQFGAFTAACIYLYKCRNQLGIRFSRSFFRMRKEPLAMIVKLGIPQLVRVTFVHFSMLWVNANINAYGLVASATNSIGNKIQKFLNVFMGGVDSASSAMIAQNLGAQKPERAKKTLLYTLGSCLLVATFSSSLGLLIPRELFGIFTGDAAVKEFGVTYMRIMVMTFYVSAITGSLQTMVTGSGFVTLGYLIGIMDGVICRVGFSLLFLHVFDSGIASFFWGTAFSRTIPGLICLIYFLSGKWRTRKLIPARG